MELSVVFLQPAVGRSALARRAVVQSVLLKVGIVISEILIRLEMQARRSALMRDFRVEEATLFGCGRVSWWEQLRSLAHGLGG